MTQRHIRSLLLLSRNNYTCELLDSLTCDTEACIIKYLKLTDFAYGEACIDKGVCQYVIKDLLADISDQDVLEALL